MADIHNVTMVGLRRRHDNELEYILFRKDVRKIFWITQHSGVQACPSLQLPDNIQVGDIVGKDVKIVGQNLNVPYGACAGVVYFEGTVLLVATVSVELANSFIGSKEF